MAYHHHEDERAEEDTMHMISVAVTGYQVEDNEETGYGEVLYEIRTRVASAEFVTESCAWKSMEEVEEALGLEGSDAPLPSADGEALQASCCAIEKLLDGYLSGFDSVDVVPPRIRSLLALDMAVVVSEDVDILQETQADVIAERQHEIARISILRTLARVLLLLRGSLDQVEIYGQLLLVSAVVVDIVRRYSRNSFHFAFPWVLGSAGGSALLSHWLMSKVVHRIRALRKQVKSAGSRTRVDSSETPVQQIQNTEDAIRAAEVTDIETANSTDEQNNVEAECKETQHEIQHDEDNTTSEEVKLLVERYDELYKTGSLDLYSETVKGVREFRSKHEGSAPTELLYWVCIGAEQVGSSLLRTGEKQKALEVLSTGVEYGEAAVKQSPSSSKAFKYLAIVAVTHGRAVGGTNAKIQSGVRFYELTKKAIELNPEDPTLHFMMGKFQYEVAFLSWVERKLAGAIFGAEPPSATVQEALQSFKEAVKRRPNGLATTWDYYEMAKCHIANKDKEAAKEELHAATLQVAKQNAANEQQSVDDIRAMEAVEQLLSTL